MANWALHVSSVGRPLHLLGGECLWADRVGSSQERRRGPPAKRPRRAGPFGETSMALAWKRLAGRGRPRPLLATAVACFKCRRASRSQSAAALLRASESQRSDDERGNRPARRPIRRHLPGRNTSSFPLSGRPQPLTQVPHVLSITKPQGPPPRSRLAQVADAVKEQDRR